MVSIAICFVGLVIAAESASQLAPVAVNTVSASKSAWLEQWSERQRVQLDWHVVRDSRRDGSFGFEQSSTPAKGQLRLDTEQARIDQDCLVVRGRDGEFHPQDRTTSANRLDFRHALFHQHLAGPNPVPQWTQISLSITANQPLPDSRWGSLIQLSSLAPVLAATPHFAFRSADIELSERTAHVAGRPLPILIAKLPQSESWELWVDPEFDYRIVRWASRAKGRIVGQIDIAYNDHSIGLPTSWTVLEFDPAGYVIDFLTAEVNSVEYGHDVPDQELAAASFDGGLSDGTVVRHEPVKSFMRRLMDRPLIPLMVLSTVATLAAVWKNRAGRGIAVLLLAMATCVVWLRYLPILEMPLRPAYNELSVIWEQARDEFRLQSDDQLHPIYFSPQLQQQLESLSKTLGQSYRMRMRRHVWDGWLGRDGVDEKACLELLQLAQYDLPSLLENDQNSALRLKLIAERLQRVDQHLAGSGQSSPYVPPIPISYKLDDPRIEGF